MQEDRTEGAARTSWVRAYLIGLVIALYFIVMTVWLPSYVLKLGPVAGADPIVRDLIGSGVWFVFFALGLWALWRAQRARLI
jgi:hypothetical protein